MVFWDGVYKPDRIKGKDRQYPPLDSIGRTTDHDGDGVQDLVPLFAWNNKRINYSSSSLGANVDVRLLPHDRYPEIADLIRA